MEISGSNIKNSKELKGVFFPTDVYLDILGSKSAVLGSLEKDKEIWIYPFKILQNLHMKFQFLGTMQEVPLKEYAAHFVRRPEAFDIKYSHESFSCNERLIAPMNEALIIIWLEVDTTKPMKVIFYFFPVLQVMWPGAIGGQYSYWNETANAYLISEGRREYNFLVGSPLATNHSTPPAHALADIGNSIEVEIPTGKTQIPFLVMGGKIKKEILEQKFQVTVNSLQKIEEKNTKFWSEIFDAFPLVETPNQQLNKALTYAFLALENSFINNPDLGLGMVAGYSLSHNTTRPGFAWFFGGDCFYNVLALNNIGRYSRSKQALKFFQKYQRADGKIPHEISQSAAMISWFEDYPYPFYHADTTLMYLLAIWDYFSSSGDEDFLKEIWESAKKAYTYCLENSDDNALVQNTTAGMAAAELGSLLEKLKIDIYLASLSVKSHFIMKSLSEQVNDMDLAQKVANNYRISKKSLIHFFWNKDEHRFNYAVLQNDKSNDELTAWSALPLVLDVVDDQYGEKQVTYLSSRCLSTDWGHRMLSCNSSAYSPTAYNNGAVWPFLTGYSVIAEYKYYRIHSGWQHLLGLSHLPFFNAPGRFHEVISGEFFRPLNESVPNQIFSAGGLIIGFFRGLMGFKIDQATQKIKLAPKMPYEWKTLNIRNLCGFNLKIQRTKKSYNVTLKATNTLEWVLNFAIPLPIFSKPLEVQMGNENTSSSSKLDYKTELRNGYTILKGKLKFSGKVSVLISHTPGIDVGLPPHFLTYGQRSQALKLICIKKKSDLAEKVLNLYLEGFPSTYNLYFDTPFKIKRVSEGLITPKEPGKFILTISFKNSSDNSHSFLSKVIEVEFD